ncbi:MAG: hypothetical protein H6822_14920 [Planctomycetaceae bacterium]|nr:hypothetical protein [Planctomycetales bacterium]MCB9923472.1 hypothetical protein [Planctomycetaceae bacterium]
MSTRRLITAAGFFVLVTCFSGCALIGSKHDKSHEHDESIDNEPEWLTNLKSLKGTGASTGVSPEARDIERSLLGN